MKHALAIGLTLCLGVSRVALAQSSISADAPPPPVPPASSAQPAAPASDMKTVLHAPMARGGFHAQVDLATMLTEGHEAEYLGRNWKMFSPIKGISAEDRDEFLRTYGNPEGMRAGFRHYAAMLDDGRANRAAFTEKLTIPVLVLNAGLGIPQAFPGEQVRLSRRWAERRFAKLVHFNELDRGGHFAALEQPAAFVEELRATFAGLR